MWGLMVGGGLLLATGYEKGGKVIDCEIFRWLPGVMNWCCNLGDFSKMRLLCGWQTAGLRLKVGWSPAEGMNEGNLIQDTILVKCAFNRLYSRDIHTVSCLHPSNIPKGDFPRLFWGLPSDFEGFWYHPGRQLYPNGMEIKILYPEIRFLLTFAPC